MGMGEMGPRGNDSGARCFHVQRKEEEHLLAYLWGKGLGEARGWVLLSGQVVVTAAGRTRLRWGRCKVEMPYFYDRLGYQSEEESYALLQERRDRPCSSQAFHLTPAVILVPAPVFAVVIVSSAWSQLLNQWPEISHWQPQVA